MHHNKEPYDGLPPSDAVYDNRPPDRVSEVVTDICFELAKITLGAEVPYLTSNVICRIQEVMAATRSGSITSEQRDRLLRGVALARPFILDSFDDVAEWSYAKEGVDALRVLIVLWSETPETRAIRPTDIYADARTRARWLRNACHNICLRQEIDSRAAKRRSAVVVRLVRVAA